MFGVKINEFDNSDGKLSTFNAIFPKTPLEGDGNVDVEILNIHEPDNKFGQSPFIRNVLIGNRIVTMNFGEENFVNNVDFLETDRVRFKYYARDLEGKVIASSYNCAELAKKLGCSEQVIKKRLVQKVSKHAKTNFLFNVTRKEL
jgi:hypothetical protein